MLNYCATLLTSNTRTFHKEMYLHVLFFYEQQLFFLTRFQNYLSDAGSRILSR